MNLGIEKYISGVILYDETFYQKAADGTKFVDLLKSKGIVPGVKVKSSTRFLLFGSYIDVRWIQELNLYIKLPARQSLKVSMI